MQIRTTPLTHFIWALAVYSYPFTLQLPYLKSYIVYARMNEKAQELLMTVETKPAYIEFVKSWEKLGDVRPLFVGSFLFHVSRHNQNFPRYNQEEDYAPI